MEIAIFFERFANSRTTTTTTTCHTLAGAPATQPLPRPPATPTTTTTSHTLVGAPATQPLPQQSNAAQQHYTTPLPPPLPPSPRRLTNGHLVQWLSFLLLAILRSRLLRMHRLLYLRGPYFYSYTTGDMGHHIGTAWICRQDPAHGAAATSIVIPGDYTITSCCPSSHRHPPDCPLGGWWHLAPLSSSTLGIRLSDHRKIRLPWGLGRRLHYCREYRFGYMRPIVRGREVYRRQAPPLLSV